MVKFVDYVASQERKRKVRMICSSWPQTKGGKQKRTKRRSLVTGVPSKPIGSNVKITKTRVLKRMSKNDSVLHKHVKWLKDLQEERRRLEEKKEAEMKEKLQRKRIFMEREAKKRVAGKLPTVPPSAVKDEICKDNHPVVSDDDDSTVASTIASTISNCSSSKRKKPAWCQSETDREAAEEDEEINLLSFVDGLDFEQYTQDLELQTLMGQVKDRIKLLEREHKKDETKLQTCLDSESAAIRAKALEHGPVVDFVPQDINDDEHDTEEDETKSIANSVMSCESSIGSIHSKKSLTALVSKARERMSEMNPIIEEDEKDQAISPPVVSTVTDDDGQRRKEMKSINKLAFTKRNPAL